MANEPLRTGPLAVIAIRLRNTIFRRYSRRGAQRYEARRQGARWAAEARAFEHFYRRIDPKAVLDCPVGTGRWFDIYRSNGARVLGVDISEHMLEAAAKKIRAGDPIRLEKADALDPRQPAPLGSGHDLIVCSRFVYWLRPAELAIMLQRFHTTGAPLLLAGAKVALEETGPQQQAGAPGWARRLDRLRAHLYRAFVKRVYEEAELLAIFERNGWRLSERRPVVATSSMRYFYYLFARSGAGDAQGKNSAL